MSLLITQAKPNPTGKDRAPTAFTPRTQLAGEWVDFKNMTANSVSLENVELYHYAYLSGGGAEWRLVTGFSGSLPSGHVVRVHSGEPIPLSEMRLEDRTGADYHVFSHKDYVWNNSKKDYPRLWLTTSRQWIDKTVYDSYPTEGKILKRVGETLV